MRPACSLRSGPAIWRCWTRPIAAGLASPALDALVDGGWLDDAATVVVEHGVDDPFEPPAALTVRDHRRYGKTGLTFLSRRPTPG